MNELEPTSVEPTQQGIESQNNQQKQDVSNDKKPPRTIEELERELKETRAEAKQRRLAEKELTEKLSAYEAEKAEREKQLMIEQGKYQELYEKKEQELQLINKTLAEKAPLAEKYIEIETKKREELLSKLPDDLKEEMKTSDVNFIEKIVLSLNVSKSPQGVASNNNGIQSNNINTGGRLTYPFQGLD